jgi:acetyl-CoA carboxylase carboxyltransferase component
VTPPDAAAAATAVRDAVTAARRGSDPGRWPEKLPVADRLAVLLDPGSWTEDGLLANARAGDLPADGVRTGVGRIDGRLGPPDLREADPDPGAGGP